jgi:hypothetical protein
MADTSATATRETGGTKFILRLIRSTPASNPETGALRAEVEGLRLALSIAQEALREERSDKEHWRDEAKQLRQLLSGQKPEPKIINVAAPEAPHTVEAPTLGPALKTEPEKRPSFRNDFGRFSSASASALVGPAIRLSSSATKHPIWGRHAMLQPGKLPRAGDGERKPRPAGAPIPRRRRGFAASPPARIHAQLDARRTNRHSR